MDVERVVYDTNKQPKRASFKYDEEVRLCLGVAKVEIKDGTIIGKSCPVFHYTEKKIFTIDALQKRNHELIFKNKESYFVVVTMSRKN